ncbi:MAG: glycine zipper 2TM domain-containing protein [Ferrimonas sp.]
MTVCKASIVLIMLFFMAYATGYERNQAVAIQKVEYGQVLAVHYRMAQRQHYDQYSNLKVLGGAVLGGIIGSQFGRGLGRDLSTAAGALAGSSIVGSQNPPSYLSQEQQVELTIQVENHGPRLLVNQRYDPNMPFNIGDLVRWVFLTNGTVRVDLAR